MSFRADMATAMAVYYLNKAPNHELNDLKLMKLMFFAERKCIEETTSLITGDQFFSMQHGPVMSEVWDLMQGTKTDPLWDRCIEFIRYCGDGTDSNKCVLKQSLDVTKILAEYEIELLDKMWAEHGHKNKWSLVDLSHDFPEWDKTRAKMKSATPIRLETIFEKGLHESHEEAKDKAAEIQYFERVFK